MDQRPARDPDELRDDQWERIKPIVPGGIEGRRGPRSDGRRFVNALLWMARSGARWRDLPERFGNYQTVKKRYYRWVHNGVIDKLFERVASDPDLEWAAIDATIIRAHGHAAGARKRGDWKPNPSWTTIKHWDDRGAGSAPSCTR